MKRKFLSLAAVLNVVLLQAQETKPQAGEKIITGDAVTVTATKTERKQSETGKVVTIITKAEIEKNAGKTLGQLLNNQVGLTINGALNNAGTNQTIFMRGASSGRTLILIDGVPVSDPSLIGNEYDINLLSLANIERIEILKGAQSTLYGSDAIAGVINIISNKSKIDKAFNFNAVWSYGSFNTLRTHNEVYGKLKKLEYKIGASNVSTNGFSTANDAGNAGNFDNDGFKSSLLNTYLKYQLAKHLQVKAFVQYSKNKTDLDNTRFKDERDFVLNNNSTIAGAGLIYKKQNWQIVSNYQYSDVNRNFLNDSVHKPGFSYFERDNYFGKNQFAELYTNVNLKNGFALLAGIDHRFNNMNSQYFSTSFFGPYSSNTKDSFMRQNSAYASIFYNSNNKKITVELGTRTNNHSRYGNNKTFTFNPSYAINDAFRVFGSYATAFKAPTLYQLYSSYGNINLKPEENKNIEIGLQGTKGIANARIVAFRRKTDNAIDFDNINYNYINVTKQTVIGLEFETAVNIANKLQASINYTYLKPDEKSQSRETFNDTTYTYLLRRPNHSLNVNISYNFTEKASAGITAKYVSNRYDVGGFMSKDVLLKSYVLLGANAVYKVNEKVVLFADAQNLSNTKFFDLSGYNSTPFQVSFGVRFKF